MLSERQIQIIEKSIELISLYGIQGFTINNLSKAIGTSQPAIYRHFDSKTDILIAILNKFEEMAVIMNSKTISKEGNTIEKIEFLFTQVLNMFTKNPIFISVIFSEEIFKNEQILRKKIVQILNIYQNNIENVFENGQTQNEIRKDIDSKNLALIFMGALRLLVKRWDLNDKNFNLKKEGKKLINSLKLMV